MIVTRSCARCCGTHVGSLTWVGGGIAPPCPGSERGSVRHAGPDTAAGNTRHKSFHARYAKDQKKRLCGSYIIHYPPEELQVRVSGTRTSVQLQVQSWSDWFSHQLQTWNPNVMCGEPGSVEVLTEQIPDSQTPQRRSSDEQSTSVHILQIPVDVSSHLYRCC